MPYKNHKKQKEYQKLWARKNRKSQRKYMRKVRRIVIDMLGGKCINCGCIVCEALEINHIKGGGNKEIRKVGRKSFLLSIYNGSRKTDDLEIRCRVCNAIHYLIEIKKLSGKWIISWEP